MGFTLIGLVLLAFAPSFLVVLVAAACVGIGSSVFHPESSRVARMASGGRHGFAQSLFQVGGNAGSAIGPLLAAFIVLPHGQRSIAWFAVTALVGMTILARVGAWYKAHLVAQAARPKPTPAAGLPRPHGAALAGDPRGARLLEVRLPGEPHQLLHVLPDSTSSAISVQSAQLHLFLFLGAVAAGTFIGGPVGDRIGRKKVIWVSILGVLPFTLLLPYASLRWTEVLTVVIGLILASAFSAIVVFAQELVPGRVGTISGLFFGFAFGAGAVGAALLGVLADATSIDVVYRICAFLPAHRPADVFPAGCRARTARCAGVNARQLSGLRRGRRARQDRRRKPCSTA